MNVATKICRVCGKEYAACRSAKRSAGVFRWQEVACSPECGAKYLRLINDSRCGAVRVDNIAIYDEGEELDDELFEKELEDALDTE